MMNQGNRNRQGYKKTKVGWIPEEWDFDYVGNVCSIENRLRLPISLEQRKKIRGVYPYYGPTGILGYIDHYRIEGTFALIGEDGDHFLKYRNRQMTQLISGKFNVNNHAHLVKGNSKCSTEWFFWFFNHRDIKAFLTRQGTGRFKLNKEALTKLPIVLPPLPEQKKIAEILSTCDRTIHLTARMIEAKTRMKKGLMQQLLTGRMRFPEFGKPAKKKGELPEGWKIKRLSDIAFINPETISEKTPKSYEFCYIDIGAVKEGSITFPITEVRFENAPSRARRKINRNDILLSTVRPNLKGFAHIDFSSDNYICSTGFAVIRTKECYASRYIYYNLYSSYTEKYFNGCVLGSNYPALNNSDIEQLRIPCPSEIEQKKIAETLSAVDDEINLLRKQEAAHKKQKKALMQKLLFGEIRVNTISNDIISNDITDQEHGLTENRV